MADPESLTIADYEEVSTLPVIAALTKLPRAKSAVLHKNAPYIQYPFSIKTDNGYLLLDFSPGYMQAEELLQAVNAALQHTRRVEK
jgi:hypothetical protein